MSNVAKLEIYIWWCQDSYCDCTKPVADIVTLRLNNTVSRREIWSGKFISHMGGEPEPEEIQEQADDLKRAALFFSLQLCPIEMHGLKQIRLDMCPACGSNAWWLTSYHKCSSKDEKGNWIQVDPLKEIARCIKDIKPLT